MLKLFFLKFWLHNSNQMSARYYKDVHERVNYFHPIQLPIQLVIDHDDDSGFEAFSCGNELIVVDET